MSKGPITFQDQKSMESLHDELMSASHQIRSLMDKWVPVDDKKYPVQASSALLVDNVSRPHRMGVGAKPTKELHKSTSLMADDKGTMKIKRQMAKQKAADLSNEKKTTKMESEVSAREDKFSSRGRADKRKTASNANDILSEYLNRPNKKNTQKH